MAIPPFRSCAGGPAGLSLCLDGSDAVCGYEDGSVRRWALDYGRPTELTPHGDGVSSVALPPGRPPVTAGLDGRLVEQAAAARTLVQQDRMIKCVAASPCGRWLAVAGLDGQIQLWSLQSDQPVCSLSGHRSIVRQMRFSTAGYLLSASDDRTVRCWDLENQECFAMLEGHDGAVMGISQLERTGWVLTVGTDNALKLWLQPAPDRGLFNERLSSPREYVQRLEALRTKQRLHASECYGCASWGGEGGDRRLVATIGDDKLVKLWTVNILEASCESTPRTRLIHSQMKVPTISAGPSLQQCAHRPRAVGFGGDGLLGCLTKATGELLLWDGLCRPPPAAKKPPQPVPKDAFWEEMKGMADAEDEVQLNKMATQGDC